MVSALCPMRDKSKIRSTRRVTEYVKSSLGPFTQFFMILDVKMHMLMKIEGVAASFPLGAHGFTCLQMFPWFVFSVQFF